MLIFVASRSSKTKMANKKMKKVLFLTLVFGAGLFLGISSVVNAQVTSCMGQADGTGCVDSVAGTSGVCQSNACVNSSHTLPLDQNMTTTSTVPLATTTAASKIPTGNGGCHSDSDCASNNCSMTGSDYVEEGGAAAGTCRAIGASTPQTGATTQPATTPQTGASTGAKLSGTGIVIPEGTGLPDPPNGVAQIIRNLLTWLLGIVGVIAIIGFVISGIQYLTSAGDEDQMQSAKRNMLYAIIGVVVVLSSYVIIQAIQYALEARSMF
jgi:hypothetical protein